MPDSERLLIKSCIDGNRAAQSRLYDIYHTKMMGTCMWYAKNKEEAEEILQDGFIRVFKYLSQFRAEGSFEGWVRKAMISAALSKYRNKLARVRMVVEFNSNAHDLGEEAFFIYRYDEKALVKLIQTLSPAYRLVFNLYVFEGLNHREIAKALNISENTSKSNLADARKILQSALTIREKEANI